MKFKLVFTLSHVRNSVRIPKRISIELKEIGLTHWDLMHQVLWLYLAERGVNPNLVHDFNTYVMIMQEYNEKSKTNFYHFSITELKRLSN